MIQSSLQFCADRVIPEKAIHPESLCRTNISGTITGDSIMRRIPLTQRQFALVDDEDYEELSKHKWYAAKDRNGNFYARKWGTGGHVVYMHRHIMDIAKNALTDHKNRNTLDNQKHNLRKATKLQNARNATANKNGSSQYKGVSWYKRKKRWHAQICQNRKIIHIGYFVSEVEAAKAYDEKAKELHGEFAYLNFPTGTRPSAK